MDLAIGGPLHPDWLFLGFAVGGNYPSKYITGAPIADSSLTKTLASVGRPWVIAEHSALHDVLSSPDPSPAALSKDSIYFRSIQGWYRRYTYHSSPALWACGPIFTKETKRKTGNQAQDPPEAFGDWNLFSCRERGSEYQYRITYTPIEAFMDLLGSQRRTILSKPFSIGVASAGIKHPWAEYTVFYPILYVANTKKDLVPQLEPAALFLPQEKLLRLMQDKDVARIEKQLSCQSYVAAFRLRFRITLKHEMQGLDDTEVLSPRYHFLQSDSTLSFLHKRGDGLVVISKPRE